MKFLIITFVFYLTVNSVFGLPARDPKDDAEFVSVPRGQQGITTQTKDYSDNDDTTDPDFKNFKGVIDTGAGYPFLSPLPYNPFSFNSGFFDNFEDIFRRLRERVMNTWSTNIPQPGDADWNPSDGNSTSEVKVIDGHKVVINDTVYTKKDDDGNAIFRVRILNIRPVDDSSEENQTPSDQTSNPTSENDNNNNTENSLTNNDKGSPEIVEKQSKDNEISGNIDSTESTPQKTSQISTSTIKNNHYLHLIPDIGTENAQLFVINNINNRNPEFNSENLKIDEENVKNLNKFLIPPLLPLTIETDNNKNNDNDKKLLKNVHKENLENDKNIQLELKLLNDRNDRNEEKEDDENEDFINKNINEKKFEKYQNYDIDVEDLDAVTKENNDQSIKDTQDKSISDVKHEFLDAASYKTESLEKRITSTINDDNNNKAKGSTEIDSSEEEEKEGAEAEAGQNQENYENDKTDSSSDSYNSEWFEDFQEWAEKISQRDNIDDDYNKNNNIIDMYESIPVDLSNDIAINQMLADQGAPQNPDAEIISIDDLNAHNINKNNYHHSIGRYQEQHRFLRPDYATSLLTNSKYSPIKK